MPDTELHANDHPLAGENALAGYFLGADIGGSKTQVWIADENGRALGSGKSGPGNHEIVGYAGLVAALQDATNQALQEAQLDKAQITGAGFGVAGYDWPSEREPTRQAVQQLGLPCPIELVNDTLLGLLAGASQGWGIAVVSGTGCNCWGRDRNRREGRVIGHSLRVGEAAGASELVFKAMHALAYEWTRRGPRTQLTSALIAAAGARDLADLLEGYCEGHYAINASAAPLVFEVAAAGDPVAIGLIQWAGRELGELVNAVIRQLEFEPLAFDVVEMGSMFAGGPLLIEPMIQTIHALAPGARFVRLSAPPVAGAVILGMEAAGMQVPASARQALCLRT